MRRFATPFLLAIIVVLLNGLAAAQEAAFTGGGQIGDGAATYDAGPFVQVYQDTLWVYATGEDGQGYYTTYEDGQGYAPWTAWGNQPAAFRWQPTAVVFNDNQYVFYDGSDGGLYHNAYDGSAWTGWENLAGDFTFKYAPFANAYEDGVYLYGVADTGDLHFKVWAGGEWSTWTPVSDAYPAGIYQPFATDWHGYENVFWTGSDGTVYWNRYDGSEWTGAEALPYAGEEVAYASAPYAIGYSGDDKLYAYAISREGAPNWNVFTDGEGWSGWQAYKSPLPGKAAFQPNAYEYDGIQHLIVTGVDGSAYYTTYDGAYGEWADLGQNYDYDPFQYEYGGNLYLTYVGSDGLAYVQPYGGG